MSANRRQFLQTSGGAAAALLPAVPALAQAAATRVTPPSPPFVTPFLAEMEAARRDPFTLWYERPADTWVQALPLGNGRLGAMVFGGISTERLQINENSFFAGGPYDPTNPKAREALPRVQQLVFEGRYQEAEALANDALISVPRRQMPYQPLAELVLVFPGLENPQHYQRELDLQRAVARTRFATGSTEHLRESFASQPDQVLVTRLAGNKPRSVTVDIAAWAPHATRVEADGEHTLVLAGTSPDQGEIRGRLPFEVRLQLRVQGGSVRARPGGFYVQGADELLLLLVAATGYRRFDDVSGDPAAATRGTLARLAGRGPDALRQAHEAEHRRLFDRVSLQLGAPEPRAGDKPTDQRVRDYGTTPEPALPALYFHYGRYLLMASSRGTRHPSNLQGLWNEKMQPSWQSKWTLNINTQMNHWPAEPCRLGETVEPLFALVEDLSVTGAKLAREMYGAPGWVAHNNTDVWRVATPPDGAVWAMWPTGGPWLLQNLWEAWLFRRERTLLERLYPLMVGSARFHLATLLRDPRSGHLVTNPSLSPENRHPQGSSLCAGPAIDNQLLRDLFSHVEEAAALLGRDADFAARCREARAQLPPDRVSSSGLLQEWQEDWDAAAPDPQHRHVSHLYALFPSNQITLQDTPALAAAARRTMDRRGDDTTGWGIGWRINLWARLQDGERAFETLRRLLHPRRTYPNLFDAHPPFQIDGNFGGTAGIAEMLLQSHRGEIHLLPALPSAWAEGAFSGLAARGGFEVDLRWRDARPEVVALRAPQGGDTRLRWREQGLALSLRPGEAAECRLVGGRLVRAA